MADSGVSKGTAVIFSNYNYAFEYFNDKYVQLCLNISETLSLREVRRMVSAFVYEFNYGIPSPLSWEQYKLEIDQINKAVNEDIEYNRLIEKDDLSFREQVEAYPVYYRHLVKYLNLLSRYVAELSATYMPRTRLQKNLLKYKNDSPFYNKLHEFKRVLFDRLSEFKIQNFRTTTNTFITFFYAYQLFISEKYASIINKVISNVLSIFVDNTTVDLLSKYPGFSNDDLKLIYELETHLHDAVLYCNSLVNESLSSYGVLPKIQPKVYNDRTLI